VSRSAAVQRLHEAGYVIYALGWSLRRLRVQPLSAGPLAHVFEAPSFVATIAPDELLTRCRTTGWRVLRPRLGRTDR
jgi:hypothetical protein